ncbi:MAG: UPF0149 family protein [Hyphomicrobiaceae bacterium]
MPGLREPLNDTEFDRLSDLLARSERAMNMETLDGFFAALICGPDMVRPSEYLPVIWGGTSVGGEHGWCDDAEMQEFFDLLMRHWNSIAGPLGSGDVVVPVLLEDDEGIARANDWATGFVRGMKLRAEAWAHLMDDTEHAGLLVPIFALAHEHDPDPTMRPYKEPIDAERREQLVIGAAAGVVGIYRYFAARRTPGRLGGANSTPPRPGGKVGRNDPCPCGSGKKFKKCCGGVSVH